MNRESVRNLLLAGLVVAVAHLGLQVGRMADAMGSSVHGLVGPASAYEIPSGTSVVRDTPAILEDIADSVSGIECQMQRLAGDKVTCLLVYLPQ